MVDSLLSLLKIFYCWGIEIVNIKLIMLYFIYYRLDLDKWINELLLESLLEDEFIIFIFVINYDDFKYVD